MPSRHSSFSNYEWDWFKYIFTMMDHFTKYGWVIPLNDNKPETILKPKNESSHIIFLVDIRPINEENSKTMFVKIFVNLKELPESMEYITLQRQVSEEVSNRIIQNFFSRERPQKK